MYKTEEERLAALRASRNNSGKREWYCNVCNNGKNYNIRGRTNHLKSQKHQMNLIIQSEKKTIQEKSFVNNLIFF